MSKYKKYEWLLLLVLVSIIAGSSYDLIRDLYFTTDQTYKV